MRYVVDIDGTICTPGNLAKQEFYEFTEIQLSLWGCKYHQLFLGKPSGDYYIDDKGINDNDFFKTEAD